MADVNLPDRHYTNGKWIKLSNENAGIGRMDKIT